MAFFKCGGGSGTKVYSLGTGTASKNDVTYNIKTLLPDVDYTKLTADNFIVETEGYSASTSSNGSSLTPSVSSMVSKTYDSTTGVLTISDLSATGSKSQSGYTNKVTVKLSVSDCYLIDGKIEN